jgi:hypothetical protein
MSAIVGPLQFLRLLNGVPAYNALANTYFNPFKLIVDRKIEFADVTDAASTGQNPAAKSYFGAAFGKCGSGTGEFLVYLDANDPKKQAAVNVPMDRTNIYTAPLPPGLRMMVFQCTSDSMTSKLKKAEFAGLAYHEANHTFGIHGFFLRSTKGGCDWAGAHPTNMNLPYLEWNNRSVYGAHIDFLLSQVKNPDLTPGERCNFYNLANKEISASHLCNNMQNNQANPCP